MLVALPAFAALLDRSFARVGELAADGRRFDRLEVARLADVWDNNTFPLFSVLTGGPRWLRERRARAALRWMAGAGTHRRSWMLTEAAAAGFPLDRVLGPAIGHPPHARGHQGLVRPGSQPLTAAFVAGPAEDYHLRQAVFSSVRAERTGDTMAAVLSLSVPRRYAAPDDYRTPTINFSLYDLRAVTFDSRDTAGATVTVRTEPPGVEVRLGGGTCLRAASAEAWIEDDCWHLSDAGRAADAVTPPFRRPERRDAPRGPALGAGGTNAAFAVQTAAWEVRAVRYAHVVGKIPLTELSQAFADVGPDLRAISADRAARRDAAFQRLVDKWTAASPHLAHRIGSGRPLPRPPDPAGLPDSAQLTLVSHASGAVLNYATPGDWLLHARKFPGPAHLMFTTAAFAEPLPFTRAADGTLTVGDRALTFVPGN